MVTWEEDGEADEAMARGEKAAKRRRREGEESFAEWYSGLVNGKRLTKGETKEGKRTGGVRSTVVILLRRLQSSLSLSLSVCLFRYVFFSFIILFPFSLKRKKNSNHISPHTTLFMYNFHIITKLPKKNYIHIFLIFMLIFCINNSYSKFYSINLYIKFIYQNRFKNLI